MFLVAIEEVTWKCGNDRIEDTCWVFQMTELCMICVCVLSLYNSTIDMR